MRLQSLGKYFTIGGAILAEVYMALTALAPNAHGGPTPPLDVEIKRLLVLGIFFGPFGGAVGLGVWMLLLGLLQNFQSTPPPPEEAEKPPEPKKPPG